MANPAGGPNPPTPVPREEPPLMAQSNKPKPVEAANPDQIEETPMRRLTRIHYNDNTFEVVNLNRPNLMVVFAAAHEGKAEPETTTESLWLMWHALGRPVVGDVAGKPEADQVEAWAATVEEIDHVFVERTGKARR